MDIVLILKLIFNLPKYICYQMYTLLVYWTFPPQIQVYSKIDTSNSFVNMDIIYAFFFHHFGR